MRAKSLLGLVSMATLLFVPMTWAGCGSGTSDNTDGGGGSSGAGGSAGKGGSAGSGGSGGTSGSGGSSGSGGTSGSKDSGKDTGGSKESGSDTGKPEGGTGCTGKDCCGAAPCAKGDVCCANPGATDAAAALSCASSCSPSETLACTQATDCPGAVCCVTAVFMMGAAGTMFPSCLATDIVSASSVCGATCAENVNYDCNADTDHVQLCETSKDCTDSSFPECCQLPLGGETYSGCLPPGSELFLTCD